MEAKCSIIIDRFACLRVIAEPAIVGSNCSNPANVVRYQIRDIVPCQATNQSDLRSIKGIRSHLVARYARIKHELRDKFQKKTSAGLILILSKRWCRKIPTS